MSRPGTFFPECCTLFFRVPRIGETAVNRDTGIIKYPAQDNHFYTFVHTTDLFPPTVVVVSIESFPLSRSHRALSRLCKLVGAN